MRRIALTLLFVVALAANGLTAQESARARAQRTLPPDVFAGVAALANEMADLDIPDGPLFNKALEGTAKRVPAERLLPAIRAYADRLGQARTAFGPAASVPHSCGRSRRHPAWGPERRTQSPTFGPTPVADRRTGSRRAP